MEIFVTGAVLVCAGAVVYVVVAAWNQHHTQTQPSIVHSHYNTYNHWNQYERHRLPLIVPSRSTVADSTLSPAQKLLAAAANLDCIFALEILTANPTLDVDLPELTSKRPPNTTLLSSQNSTNPQNPTPLQLAAAGGSTHLVFLLLDRKANVNHRAGKRDSTPLLLATQNGRVGVSRLLLEARASVDVKAFHTEDTPLVYAARARDKQLVALLLDFGAEKLPVVEKHNGLWRVGDSSIRNFVCNYDVRWSLQRHHQATQQMKQLVFVMMALRTHAITSTICLMPNELMFMLFEWIHDCRHYKL